MWHVGLVLVRRRRPPCCLRGGCSLQAARPQPPLYTTEPKRNEKALTLPDGNSSSLLFYTIDRCDGAPTQRCQTAHILSSLSSVLRLTNDRFLWRIYGRSGGVAWAEARLLNDNCVLVHTWLLLIPPFNRSLIARHRNGSPPWVRMG